MDALLRKYQPRIQEALNRVFDRPAVSSRLRESMRYSLAAGGKRIRPVLCFAACQAVGGNVENAMPIACALEVIHTYSLIHDDLPAMDDDDLRRGRPTNHKVFGDGMAILAGDALLTEAFVLLSDPNWHLAPETRIQIISTLARAAGEDGMVAGQALDLGSEGRSPSETELEIIHQNKTGRLLHASVLAGGLAGEASSVQIKALDQYGRAIGLAFQIADDILDVTATTEELGKDARSDQKKQKATYPSLLGLETSRKKALSLLTEALSALSPLGPQGDPLKTIARFIVERRS